MDKLSIQEQACNIKKHLINLLPNTVPYVAAYYWESIDTTEFSAQIYSDKGVCISGAGFSGLSYEQVLIYKPERRKFIKDKK